MPEETSLARTTDISETITSRYIDFKLDFSFHHFFAKEGHLDLLRDFLNGVFEGRKVIKEVRLGKTERKGDQKDNRKTVFDVYCTGEKGENFVVEMQKGNQKHFKDRLLFYTANLVQEHGKSVKADWDYKLPEVYFVAVMDFILGDNSDGHYLHDVRLVEMRTKKQFYDKLGYIYIELPRFTKTLEQLETNEDKWLYCLKHMTEFKEIPVPLSSSPTFRKLFEVAEVSNLTPEEMNAYQKELKRKRDNYSHDQYILEQGLEQGKLRARHEMALQMINEGYLIEEIIKLTRLTKEEILALKK
ncbi:putative transposase/invertase (TIGR01784 family) [Pedobacter africanus]|uniref:Transposase/invertase (TIGR01784 family) n=1 Tax=Pedobacter africanus TaxID=151894 RepID=A0ACC6KZL3_9SPHI|nr:Rpn family recombination-promoting nuclease/putative transposase [Pedobacter africanus]MDR6784568.1 putative transposase/invertase (TIGR01784 family) [Pedobacter africanus]